MSKIKNIAVFTSTRAEYGLLLPILRKIKEDTDLGLRLLVSGSHLSHKFGYTIERILEDDFEIEAKLPFISGDKDISEAKSMGILSGQIADYLENNKPDILIVLGDRFELLPVVSVALVLNIPIAHISGGDVTEGAIDNQIRHAITKMSHLHFPATEIYRQNLLQMGEEDWRICVAGEPGLDQVLQMNFIAKKDLYEGLGLPMNKEIILATFHPETIDNQITPDFIRDYLLSVTQSTDYTILVTGANFDQGGDEINNTIRQLAIENGSIVFVDSLGQKRYYSMLSYVVMVIGNSSSGLTEVQSFKIPAINVGKRQQGRLFNPNVMHVEVKVDAIIEAMEYVLTDEFKMGYINELNIYGDGNSADRIIEKIKSVELESLLMKKSVFSSSVNG